MTPEATLRAAQALASSRLDRRLFDRLAADIRPESEDDAYRVQDEVNRILVAAGRGPLAGHKIGCTTPVMQRYLGIDNPCAGRVFLDDTHHLEADIATSPPLRLGVECEIAVRLRHDLRGKRSFTAADAAGAVGSVMAAIEIVEDRYVDYPSLDTPTLIADDFFSAGCVLGAEDPAFPAAALSSVTARMTINGREVGRGTGSDVLGDPMNALAWLATASAGRGGSLRSGEFILLGSLVATVWVEAGDIVRIENDGLGVAVARFR